MQQIAIPSLIKLMMQPEFYPHAVTEPIQLIQTHISYVLLTGDYVYKVKKPVNLGFLNFSTLIARHHFCQEELRLNRLLAPEIYLEVLPITQQKQNFILGGDGEPQEYTLKMRQFSQDALLSKMLKQGKLNPELMEQLGRIVAKVHLQAATNDYIRSFGDVSQIKYYFAENYQQSQKYIGSLQTQLQYEETKQFSDRFLSLQTPLLKQRQENNWIRECHGDLHLDNICLWHNKIQLFDRIEFNEPFRFVDVMYDVAFLVMDLEAAAEPELANVFLNTYIERTGDWSGLALLPLYLSRQAYVRAKVNSWLWDNPTLTEENKRRAGEKASNYYHLAWEYSRSRQGKLIMMSGLSGSGKTTVARRLARSLRAIHLRSDAVRKHLSGTPLDESGTPNIYTTEMTQKTYDRLLELGINLASRGFTVILDAKYDRRSFRNLVITQAQNNQIPLEIFFCTAPDQVLRDRILARTGDISDATVDLLESQKKAFEAFTEEEELLLQENRYDLI
ncbi:MAG: AAA family ATPase [Xenococcus sp. (in: cyanobacteria)]